MGLSGNLSAHLPAACGSSVFDCPDLMCFLAFCFLAGNIKVTTPIAFSTTVLVWALMTFGRGFEAAGQVWGPPLQASLHPLPHAHAPLGTSLLGCCRSWFVEALLSVAQ